MIELRPMTEADLPGVTAWMQQPHVARWWPPDTVAAELEQYRQRVNAEGEPSTVLLVITEDGLPIGWCQWYRWDSYPEEAEAMEALPGELGIDYAIGEPGAVGRGLGTEMIAALVAEVHSYHPGAGLLVDPDAANLASRRVLERNGFELVAVRPVASEPTDDPMAIYRLPARRDHAPADQGPADHAPGDQGAGDQGAGEAPGRVLLVDAANVVGSRPTGWWRDRAGAARRLVDRLGAPTADGRLDPPVVVVLEGAARSGAAEGDPGAAQQQRLGPQGSSPSGIRVVHAAGSADDRLVQLAAASALPVVLVSADRELRRRVTALGGRCVGPDWLFQRLGG